MERPTQTETTKQRYKRIRCMTRKANMN